MVVGLVVAVVAVVAMVADSRLGYIFGGLRVFFSRPEPVINWNEHRANTH